MSRRSSRVWHHRYVTWRARLHVVTGKGGVGKTTVAAALALALAHRGQRVLLAEVEGRQGLAQLFELDPLPYGERRLGEVDVDLRLLAIDAEEALLEYLDLFYKMGRAGRVLRKLGAIDFATTVAPGLRDILLTGKVKEATTRTDDRGRRMYGAVVLDAPPTGRIGRFLNVTCRGGAAGQARTHQDAERGCRGAAAFADDVGARGDPARGDAGAGASRRIAESAGLGIPPERSSSNCTLPPLLASTAKVSQAALKRGLARQDLPLCWYPDSRKEARRTWRDGPWKRNCVRSALGRPIVELPLLGDGVIPGCAARGIWATRPQRRTANTTRSARPSPRSRLGSNSCSTSTRS
jgi:hypothetical protein